MRWRRENAQAGGGRAFYSVATRREARVHGGARYRSAVAVGAVLVTALATHSLTAVHHVLPSAAEKVLPAVHARHTVGLTALSPAKPRPQRQTRSAIVVPAV